MLINEQEILPVCIEFAGALETNQGRKQNTPVLYYHCLFDNIMHITFHVWIFRVGSAVVAHATPVTKRI